MSFDNPLALFLLPVVAALLWRWAQRSVAPLDRQQIAQSLVVRVVLAAIIILAISQPHVRVRTNHLSVVFVIDRSDSIAPAVRGAQNRYIERAIAAKGGGDRVGVVVFGRYPNLETSPKESGEYSGAHTGVNGSATDLAAALRTASLAFASDTGKKIVLLTDGRENIGSAASELTDLRNKGILVDVAPVGIGVAVSPEASVDALRLPQRVQTDAPFIVRAILRSNVAQVATVTLSDDGVPLATKSVPLVNGTSAVEFSVRERTEGLHRYTVVLAAPQDTIPQNNTAIGSVDVKGRPRVLFIATDSGPSSARAALAAQGIDSVVLSPEAAPTGVAQWQAYDSVLLDDVEATEFSPAQIESLRMCVSDFGTGLGMIGGIHSFAAGAYRGTPVEAALPVDMRVPRQRRPPPAAVVIVLDASGSMGAQVGGIEKVQLAAQAAVNLIGQLDPDDQVAVIAVTETPTTVVPLTSPAGATAAQHEIEGLHAGGGGIFCHTGLVAAYDMLERVNVPVRHVIMCADTTDSEEQEGCTELARVEYDTKRITTSMLGIGWITDPHVPFQKAVAAAGHGRMEAVSNLADLPSTFDRDVGYLKGAQFVEEPFHALENGSDPVLAGVAFDTSPPLLGHNLCTPKPTAQVPLLASRDGEPLLARWRYGLGRSFAFTSDDRPHWAQSWTRWDGYGRFWAQLIRWSLKSEDTGGLQTAVELDAGRGKVAVDALTPAGDYVDGARLSALVAGPDGLAHRVNLTQTAPGRYETSFDTPDAGLYMVRVRDDSAPEVGQSASLAVSYSPEFANIPPNTDLLKLLATGTGGRYAVPAMSVFYNTRFWDVGDLPLGTGCLYVAAFLLLVDIAWRRLGWKLRAPSAKDVQERDSTEPRTRATRFGTIQLPAVTQTREGHGSGTDDAYLTRSAATRIGGDDGDPFPFVKRK